MATAKRKETLRRANNSISISTSLQKTKPAPLASADKKPTLATTPRHKIGGSVSRNTPLLLVPSKKRTPVHAPSKKRKLEEAGFMMKRVESIIDDELYNDDSADEELMTSPSKNRTSLTPSRQNKRTRKGSLNRIHGVTLRMLLDEGILETGKNCLTIDYLGRKFIGDLLSSGKIRWTETNEIFNSPSAWAIHCKKVVNPHMKSGCGWASVRYHGTKLDHYKSAWTQCQDSDYQISTSLTELDSDCSYSDRNDLFTTTPTITTGGLHVNNRSTTDHDIIISPSSNERPAMPSCVSTSPYSRCAIEDNVGCKSPVRYHQLSNRASERDLSKQVECLQFNELSKHQPFSLSISSSAFLVMDLHSHLSCKEIVGYLAGHWDSTKQHLSVSKACPCRCQLNDWQQSFVIEDQIRSEMKQHHLQVVGWYHSHPNSESQPTLYDIDCQMDYQRTLKSPDGSILPCFAIITSPYCEDSKYKGSVDEYRKAYTVLAPPDVRCGDYGIPMLLNYDIYQDEHITQDILNEISLTVQYYEKISEFMNFTDDDSQSNLLQLRTCLKRSIPTEDTDGWLLNSITRLLTKV